MPARRIHTCENEHMPKVTHCVISVPDASETSEATAVARPEVYRSPVRGTSPKVGFIPTTPVNWAGIRLEPPSSVPRAANAIPLQALGKEPGPLGARRRGGEAAHVVDGFGNDRDAVERTEASLLASESVADVRQRVARFSHSIAPVVRRHDTPACRSRYRAVR